MVSYSHKDVEVKINSLNLFCNTAKLNYKASLSPQFNTLASYSFDFSAARAPAGSLDLVYFLTGSDPIASAITSEKTPIALYFNGLTLNSGYLTSYQLQASAFAPAQVNASFSFYEKIGGTFIAQGIQSSLPDAPPLNISDLSLEGGSVVSDEKIESVSYSYASSPAPIYVVEENFDSAGANIIGISSSQKRIQASFSLVDHQLSIPVTGQRESFALNFKDKNNVLKQTYNINGPIVSKDMSVNAGTRIKSNYSISQASLGKAAPVVKHMSPTSGPRNSTVAIAAENVFTLDNIDKVYIGEYPCELSGALTYDSSTLRYEFNIVVSPDMLSGFEGAVRVVTKDGESLMTDWASYGTFRCTSGVTYF
jgi:hypothetical protein